MEYKKAGLIRKIMHKLYEKSFIFCGNAFTKPDKKLIVFSSEPDFSDNSRVLFDYMQENGYAEKYKFVWIVNEPDKFAGMPYKNTVFVQKNDEYMYLRRETLKYLMNAHYYIGTHIRQKRIRKSHCGQTIINLWHGCGFKDTQHMPWNDAFDYVLVPGDVFIETKSKFFGCSKDMILPIGYPRYDLFRKTNGGIADFVDKFRPNKDTKLVIWMPTFRKTGKNKYPEENIEYNFALPVLQSTEELIQLDKICRDKNVVILVKKHQYQQDFGIDDKELANIRFIDNNTFSDNNIQLYEFLPHTDALISDYSSVAIDYLLIDKPIGFTLDDYESYKKTRGFVFQDPLEYMPGAHIYTFGELSEFIADVADGNRDAYKSERAEVRKHTNKYSSDFCKRIVERFEI